jgi:hypothetical protein
MKAATVPDASNPDASPLDLGCRSEIAESNPEVDQSSLKKKSPSCEKARLKSRIYHLSWPA